MDISGLATSIGSLFGPIGAIAGMVIPPAFDFVKKKFLPADADTPEATLSTLATTNPEVMVQYVEAQTKQMDSKVKYFNRDVVGEPHRWVISLRAAIRPVVTAFCCCIAGGDAIYAAVMNQPPNPAATPAWVLVGNWFGTRIR